MNFAPTLRQLEYLVTLHRTNHFSKAAEDCHVSQSTLSAGIKEMERLMGITLVERSRKRVLFTNEGEAVVRKARGILADMDQLMEEVVVARNPLAGRVSFGIIPTIAPYLLGRIMPELRRALPDIDFELIEDKSSSLCSDLRGGKLDVILYALPFHCEGVEEMPLFEDEFYAIWPKSHGPAEAQVSPDSLDRENVLLLEEGHCLKDHALSACKLIGHSSVSASGTSLATIVEMVAGGAGMTLLPAMALNAGLASDRTHDIRMFRDPAPSRMIGLVWRANSPRVEAWQKVGKVIRSAWQQGE